MRCIFCLEEKPGSEEHVFPRGIGGPIITDRVCVSCNSTLGSRVDVALTDSLPVKMRRAKLGLAGNSGEAPSQFEFLEGVGELAGGEGRKIRSTFNEETRKFDTKAIPHVSDVILPDGSQGRQILVDASDMALLPKIIQRERKRHKLPPLSEAELAALIAQGSRADIHNPSVLYRRSYDFSYLKHAFFKIAYELAFLWLGEAYLDDPSAAELREAILSTDPASTDHLPAHFEEAEASTLFKLWSASPSQHLAYAFASGDGIAVALRIFDIHAAFIWVTKDMMRYLGGETLREKLRFMVIEASNRTFGSTSLFEEILRARMIAAQEQASASEHQAPD